MAAMIEQSASSQTALEVDSRDEEHDFDHDDGKTGPSKFPRLSFMLCIPAFIVAFTGGFLISSLDATNTQIQVSFNFCGREQYEFNCTQGEYNIAYINTALFVGAILGALTCRFIAEIGRKLLLMSVSFFVIPGSLLAGLTPNGTGNGLGNVNLWWLMIVGRFIAGIGMGFVCVSVPLFVGEVTPNDYRGNFNSIQFLMQNFGSFCAVVLALAQQSPPGTTNYNNDTFDNWYFRVLLLIPVILCVVSLTALQFVTETPYILVKRNRQDEALKFLKRVHGDKIGSSEYASTVLSVEQHAKHLREGTGTPWQLLRGPNGKEYLHALLVGSALGGFQNLSGARSLLTSSSRIFAATGLSPIDSNYLTVGLIGSMLLAIYLSSLVIDIRGRRTMLLISFGGQSAAAFIGAVAYWVQTSSSTAGVVGTVSLFIFISIYGLGVAAIPCMYLAEIFPQNFKGFGMGVGASCNWAGIAAITFVTLISDNALIFSLFFGISAAAALFVFLFVRETKGLSIYGSPYFKDRVAMGKG